MGIIRVIVFAEAAAHVSSLISVLFSSLAGCVLQGHDPLDSDSKRHTLQCLGFFNFSIFCSFLVEQDFYRERGPGLAHRLLPASPALPPPRCFLDLPPGALASELWGIPGGEEAAVRGGG